MPKLTVAAALLSLSLVSSSLASADSLRIEGTIRSYVPIYEKNTNHASPRVLEHMPISLLKLHVPQYALDYFTYHAKFGFAATPPTILLSKNLGMANVPVLNQGIHGSCVTFALSGALDASYSYGDYVSELCNLELGTYLHSLDPTYNTGWDGSYTSVVLNQIKQYGIIPMTTQTSTGCMGIYTYPVNSNVGVNTLMPLSEFAKYSTNIMSNITSRVLLTFSQAFTHKLDPTTTLNNIKVAIDNNHREVMGLVLDPNINGVGAVGSYKAPSDSWILTPQILADAQSGKVNAGHAIVVIGYDDTATIIGPDNVAHQGILILRNSWGSNAGDGGNYYMSYDYAKMFITDTYEIVPTATGGGLIINFAAGMPSQCVGANDKLMIGSNQITFSVSSTPVQYNMPAGGPYPLSLTSTTSPIVVSGGTCKGVLNVNQTTIPGQVTATYTFAPIIPPAGNGTIQVAASSSSDSQCQSAIDKIFIDQDTIGTQFAVSSQGVSVTAATGSHTVRLASQTSVPAANLPGTCTSTLDRSQVNVTTNTVSLVNATYKYHSATPTISCNVTYSQVTQQGNWGSPGIVNTFKLVVNLTGFTVNSNGQIPLNGRLTMKNNFVQGFWGNFSITGSSIQNNIGSFTGNAWANQLPLTFGGFTTNNVPLHVGDNPLQSLTLNGITCSMPS